MMIDKSIIAAVAALCALVASAVPAEQRPFTVVQPDGMPVTLTLNGDEFYHFITTTDGYTVAQDKDGAYTYQRLDGERLVSTGVVAHDKNGRTATELSLLTMLLARQTDRAAVNLAHEQRAMRDGSLNKNGRRVAAKRIPGADFAYDRFRGLIVLINFNDKQFTNDADFYDKMVNAVGYKGFSHNGQYKSTVGSMRDYFNAQSNGVFSPTFDIVGPVDVDYSCLDPQGTSGDTFGVFTAALTALDDEVDFSQYDTDNDGYIDMVYFIVAGYSSNYGGNNSGYLWPHAYYLIDWTDSGYATFSLDGCTFWRYACSTEIYGWENYGYTTPLGIGTMCHEFSHVLGLPDLYDTDYSTGGQSVHPGEWDLMAGGSSANEGRLPCGYSIWERYTLGFAEPQVLDTPGAYTLNELQRSRQGYLLPTTNDKEYFLLENRQRTGWDAALPGHGMVIARVDESNDRVWEDNTVNANASRNYYVLLHADGTDATGAGVPFPGTGRVKKVTNVTNPNLLTWDGSFSQYVITGITETGSTITFNVEEDSSITSVVEDFETMGEVTAASASGLKGRFATWSFSKTYNMELPGEDYGNGQYAVSMVRPSAISMTTPIDCAMFRVSARVYVTAGSDTKLRLATSTDGGETWNDAGDVVAPAKQVSTVSWSVDIDEPVQLRVTMIAGSSQLNARTWIDDLTIMYTGDMREVFNVLDTNRDGSVNVADVNVVLSLILAEQYEAIADVNNDDAVNVADVNAILAYILANS